MRRRVRLLLLLGLLASAAELWLLEHSEEPLQYVPFVVTSLGAAALAWHAAAPERASVLVLRLAMAALIAAGVWGVVLHYRGNREFQLEIDPSLRGSALAMKVLHAKAPPSLAPGQLALLGLVGLASTYRQASAAAGARHQTGA